MDYKKSGAPKLGKNQPRYSEHTQKGAGKSPSGQTPSKAQLLARLKAAAEKSKK